MPKSSSFSHKNPLDSFTRKTSNPQRSKGRFAKSSLTLALAVSLALGGSGLSASAAPASSLTTAAAVSASLNDWNAESTVASDTFNRTQASGWGSAVTGGAYTVSGSSAWYSVTGGKGLFDIPAASTSRMVKLNGTSVADTDAVVNFSVPKLPNVGSGLRVSVYERQIGDKAYRLTALIAPNGSMTVSVGRIDDNSGAVVTLGSPQTVQANAANNASVTMQFRVTGDSAVDLAYRVYQTGAEAPDWTLAATDTSSKRISQAGTVGLWAYTSGGSAAAQVAFSSLNVDKVVKVAPATVPGAVEAPTATLSGRTGIVSWAAPAVDGGSAITGYKVTLNNETAGTSVTRDVTGALSADFTDLVPGSSYSASVVAVNSAGNGASSPKSNSFSVAPVAPSAPAAPIVTLSGGNGVNVSWAAPESNGGAPVSEYRVTLSDASGVKSQITTTNLNYTFTNLTLGSSYTATVEAKNNVGYSPVSAASVATTVPVVAPSAPKFVTSTLSGAAGVKVVWAAPDSNGGSAVTGYRVDLTSPTGAVSKNVTVPAGTLTATVSELVPGSSYVAKVTAVNAAGETSSAATPEVSIPAVAPSAPSAPVAVTNGDKTVDVSWVAPTSNGGKAILDYRVTLTDATGSTTKTVTDLKASFTGLTRGSSYTTKVEARNSVGYSPVSVSSAAVSVPFIAPSTPTNVTTVLSSANSIKVAWLAPESNGGTPVTGYHVTLSDDVNGVSYVRNITGTTSWNFTGLIPGVVYTAQVLAVNSVGQSVLSVKTANLVVPAVTPTAPAAPTIVLNGSSTVDVKWTAPTDNGGAAVTEYRVTLTNSAGSTVQNVAGLNASFTGLTAGSAYTATVEAKNSAGYSAASAKSSTVTTPAAPSAPRSVAVAVAGVKTVKVTWVAPGTDGGSPITSYTVNLTGGTGAAPKVVSVDGNTLTTTVDGLTPGATYTATVIAVNAIGSKASAASSEVAVPAVAPDAPAAPTVALSGTTGVDVKWMASGFNGGAAVTEYRVTLTNSAGSVNKTVTTLTASFTGLTPGSSYTATVEAKNSVGYSPVSAKSVEVGIPATPVTPPATTTVTAGSVPVGSLSLPVPAGAYVVSPTGSDAAKGTLAAPVKTIAQALRLAPAGATIVIRAGTYHEEIGINASKVGTTIQNYPGEEVWLDGAEVVSGWTKSGNTWVKSGWTYDFDRSPTFTRGAPDNTQAGWGFINPAYPLAAWPDQVWIDGKEMTQVATEAEVATNKFYVDQSGDRLVIGSDPASKKVEASTIQRALTIRTTNATVQGIGVKNYAPSMPTMGAVRVDPQANNATIRDVVIKNNSTMGLSLSTANNAKLERVTANDNGFIGVSSMYVDGFRATGIDVSGNNTQMFNYAPAAGGFKMVRSRDVAVDSSTFRNNGGIGLWFDESVYNAVVTNSTMTGNQHHGLMFELSQNVTAVNNYIANNAQTGLKLYSTGGGQVYNNTIISNKRGIDIVQDTRVASDVKAAGHDPRQPLPDPTMPWITKDILVANNTVGNAVSGTDCLICSQDNLKKSTGAQMNIVITGNLFQRSAANAPTDIIRWPNATSTKSFSTVTAFNAFTGQKAGVDYIGAVNSAGLAPAATQATAVAGTVPVPAELISKGKLPANGGLIGSTHK